MKKLIVIFVVVIALGLVLQAYAQSNMNLVDERFAKANQWLRQENLTITKTVTQAFVDGHIVVGGEGLPSKDATTRGEKRLTAQRAAEVVAYRNLAQFLDGVAVVGTSTTEGLALRYDVIRTAVTGFIKGAQIVYKDYNDQDETALVLVKVGMTGPASFGELMYNKILGDPTIANTVRAGVKPPEKMKPLPLDEPYDGLIIDATGENFRPALINRIYTLKGEVLYDPSKVEQKILVEKGCGEYTNSVEKARAALGSRGVKNPLVVKAAGTGTPTDLTVSDDDAVKIFSADQKAGFLTGAKVAFVLK